MYSQGRIFQRDASTVLYDFEMVESTVAFNWNCKSINLQFCCHHTPAPLVLILLIKKGERGIERARWQEIGRETRRSRHWQLPKLSRLSRYQSNCSNQADKTPAKISNSISNKQPPQTLLQPATCSSPATAKQPRATSGGPEQAGGKLQTNWKCQKVRWSSSVGFFIKNLIPKSRRRRSFGILDMSGKQNDVQVCRGHRGGIYIIVLLMIASSFFAATRPY